jgi:hypothetical protein
VTSQAFRLALYEFRSLLPHGFGLVRSLEGAVRKALLDCGEARFDHRLKFEVSEDIWPALFDAFADEFTDMP